MPDPRWNYEVVTTRLLAWLNQRVSQSGTPLFLGIDGRSGASKSTLAAAVAAQRSDTAVIEGDQFYSGGSAARWDQRSVAERAATVIDWKRQRVVLQELRQCGSASWPSFDWEAPDWDSDTVPLTAEHFTCTVGGVVILEGAYSCRPELEDLLDARVLLAPPRAVRREQLLRREGEDYRSDWERRWSAAEDHYFDQIMPEARFDLVLDAS